MEEPMPEQGVLKRIHVNQHNLKKNKVAAEKAIPDYQPLPVLSVLTAEQSTRVHGNSVEILGPSRLVHQPDDPLVDGATVWIETTAPVCIDDQITL